MMIEILKMVIEILEHISIKMVRLNYYSLIGHYLRCSEAHVTAFTNFSILAR
jgi:hypothetical protein